VVGKSKIRKSGFFANLCGDSCRCKDCAGIGVVCEVDIVGSLSLFFMPCSSPKIQMSKTVGKNIMYKSMDEVS